MTEEKLYTIDELMEGKAPGSVKITQPGMKPDYYMEPFFLDCDDAWACRSNDNQICAFRSSTTRRWKLYTEPKKKKVLRPAVICLDGAIGLSFILYESEYKAKDAHGYNYIRMAPDSYAVEIEE